MDRHLLRIRTLRRLANTVHVLLDRFPGHMTLAELNAALIGHLAAAEGKPITVSDLADRSGQHRQTISRWVQRTPHAHLEANPEDARSKLVKSNDLDEMLDYVDHVYETDLALLAMIRKNGRLARYLDETAKQRSAAN